MTQGGSGNHGIRTVRDRVSGSGAAAKSRRPAWHVTASRLQILERRRRPVGWPAGRLSAQHRQEAVLNPDEVVQATAQLLVIAGRGLTPSSEEHRVGPLGVCHEVAQKTQHGKSLFENLSTAPDPPSTRLASWMTGSAVCDPPVSHYALLIHSSHSRFFLFRAIAPFLIGSMGRILTESRDEATESSSRDSVGKTRFGLRER